MTQAHAAIAAPTPVPRPARLFLDVQHGLCNRLRAMASGAALAQATDRELVVIWTPDHHCGARIGDVLSYPGAVIESDVRDLLRARAVRIYNYMEIEPDASFGAPILGEEADPGGDIYVRTAYHLNSPRLDERDAQRFLRRLVPAPEVLELVRSADQSADVAAHIRMATGQGFNHLPHEAPSNWPEERHRELSHWRTASHRHHFVARLDVLFAEKLASRVFLAADLAETYDALEERYGDRLVRLKRDLFDRSPRQLQYALADVILLGRAPRLLASTWSSFSEVAQRIAAPGQIVERSGIDF